MYLYKRLPLGKLWFLKVWIPLQQWHIQESAHFWLYYPSWLIKRMSLYNSYKCIHLVLNHTIMCQFSLPFFKYSPKKTAPTDFFLVYRACQFYVSVVSTIKYHLSTFYSILLGLWFSSWMFLHHLLLPLPVWPFSPDIPSQLLQIIQLNS